MEGAKQHFLSANPGEKSKIALAAVRRTADGMLVDEVVISDRHDEYRTHLIAKNRQMTTLPKRYVTNNDLSTD